MRKKLRSFCEWHSQNCEWRSQNCEWHSQNCEWENCEWDRPPPLPSLTWLTKYLTSNSSLRILEEMAGYNHLNTATLVTLADNGSLRVL
jgi:hypothetical protein